MGEKILLKSPNNGCGWLREAIARYLLRSRNIAISPDCIVIGSGAEYLYGMCIQMLGRDSIIALENPSYEKSKPYIHQTEHNATCLKWTVMAFVPMNFHVQMPPYSM